MNTTQEKPLGDCRTQDELVTWIAAQKHANMDEVSVTVGKALKRMAEITRAEAQPQGDDVLDLAMSIAKDIADASLDAANEKFGLEEMRNVILKSLQKPVKQPARAVTPTAESAAREVIDRVKLPDTSPHSKLVFDVARSIQQAIDAAKPTQHDGLLERKLKDRDAHIDLFTQWALATLDGYPKSWSKYQVSRLQSIADKMVNYMRDAGITPNGSRTIKALAAPVAQPEGGA